MYELNAFVSSSIAFTRLFLIICAFSAEVFSNPSMLSVPRLLAVKLLTIDESEAPNAPASAAIEPPPGAGDSRETSSIKSVSFISTSALSIFDGKPSTRSSILKLATSVKPNDCTAVCKISRIGMPIERPCFAK